ncbi:MAG: hypothetical protein OEZ19_04650 [Paracoccaceae bacterium]|nr:hypothetical protein [Paracoccaceae bacterium]
MADKIEWSFWIEHDGRPMPVHRHDIVQIEFRAEPPDATWVPAYNPGGAFAEVWSWRHDDTFDDIIRYRFRKTRGLTMLEEIASFARQPAHEPTE